MNDQMNEIIYLTEDTDSTGQIHRFSSGNGYMSLPTDIPPNAYYAPRVEQPGLFRQNMYAVGTTSGSSSGGYGEGTLINTDGGLDSFIDLGLDGQSRVVKQGNPNLPLSQFATVITGIIEQPEVSWNRVTLRLKDKTVILNTPVQPVHYLGNNALPAGVEGTAELKDKSKPRLSGVCNNVTPICVNTSKLIYQCNSAALFDIPAVYDNGVSLTRGVDYANNALMQATAPAAGAYDTCLAEGMYRLGSSPAGTITNDAIQGATDAERTAGQIIRILAIEKLGSQYIVEQSIIDLDRAAPYVVGIYTGGDDTNTTDLLDQLCGSVGAWWGFDNLGNFWVKQLTAPLASQAIMTLTATEDTSIERLATADGDKGIPVWRVIVDYSKNWTVQSSGLAGSVNNNQLTFEPDDPNQLSTDRRNMLAMEYVRTKAEDDTVRAKHLLAPEIILKTTINSLADADTEATRVLSLRKVRRDRLKVKIPMALIKYPTTGFWDDEAISEMPQPRSDHTANVYNDFVYVIGGVTGGIYGITSPSVIRLDLHNPQNAWEDTSVTDLPIARKLHSSVIYGDYIYVIGGSTGTGYTSSVIRLNLTSPTGAWEDVSVTDLPNWRYGHSSVIYDDYLYVIGGFNGAEFGDASTSVIRLNLTSPAGAWEDVSVTNLPIARTYHSSIVYDNYLYVIGGTNGEYEVSSVIRLNLTSPASAWEDTSVTDLPHSRRSASATVIDKYLYLIAGISSGAVLSSVIRLDLTNPNDAWEIMSSLPGQRYLAAGVVRLGSIYSIGGFTTTTQPNTWLYRTNYNPDDTSQLTSLGRTVNVKYPRYGYTDGRPMKIIGTEADHQNRTMTLELWG